LTYISLLLQQLIASGTHVVGKTLTQNVDPTVVLFFRAGLVSLAYLIIIMIGRKRFARIPPKDLTVIALLGFLNIPVNQLLFLSSLKFTSAPNVALAYAMTPVFVLIIAAIFLRERITKLKGIGVLLAIAGAILIISQNGLSLSGDGLLGDILAFCASLSWALYTIIGKQPSRKYGAFYVTGLGMIFGFLFYLPLFWLMPEPMLVDTITITNWMQIAYLAFMTSGVAYALWYHALTRLDASKVSVFNNLQPILTTLLSVIFLSYVVSWEFGLGAGLIIAGVIATQKG